MGDNPNLNPMAEQLAQLFTTIFGDLTTGIDPTTPRPDEVGTLRDALNKANQTIADLRKERIGLINSKEKLRKERAALVRSNEVLETKVKTLTANIDAVERTSAARQARITRLIGENSDLARQVRSLQQVANGYGAPAVNKLRKDYTACKNQRDSFRGTIAVQQSTIKEMEKRINELQRNPHPVDVIVVDTVSYTENDVRRVVKTSLDYTVRVKQLEESLAKLNTVYDDLKKRANVYTLHGVELPPSRVIDLVNKGLKAEKAQPAASVTPVNGSFDVVYIHQGKVSKAARDVIVVTDPSNVTFRVPYGMEGTSLDVNANDLAFMSDDIQRLQKAIASTNDRLVDANERCHLKERNIKAQEREIDRLRGREKELMEALTKAQSSLRVTTVERDQARAKVTQQPFISKDGDINIVNGQVLQSGETYMTTSIGLLPVNSVGMRKLSDALDSYRARVNKLRTGISEWIKE